MSRDIANCSPTTFVLLLSCFCVSSLASNQSIDLPELERDGDHHASTYKSTVYLSPLRRQYNLEDFLWAGSGDGAESGAKDGGLAWDDGAAIGGDLTDAVRITKTMVLFKTVLTTIYPVEMTPTVLISSISATPRLVNIPSVHTSPNSVFQSSDYATMLYPSQTIIQSSPSLQLTSPFPDVAKTPEPGGQEPPSTNSSAINPAEAADRRYWVQTIIKANSSVLQAHPLFQGVMQKNLARIYAAAFKRHLMSSLGVLQAKDSNNNQESLQRVRRASFFENENEDSEWLYPGAQFSPSRLKSLATATMNVTVSILNVTENSQLSHLNLNYIVCAEGSPVPAASAVQDLKLVSKQEMESEIGYEVINKAEALVASPLVVPRTETATSPWLIVALTTIVLMVFLLLVIMFMVWKWKHNRLGDQIITPARPLSGIEGGVVNPAFLGPPNPTERSGARHDLSTIISSTCTLHQQHVKESQEKRFSASSIKKREDQKRLTSELNTLLSDRRGHPIPVEVSPDQGSGSSDGEDLDARKPGRSSSVGLRSSGKSGRKSVTPPAKHSGQPDSKHPGQLDSKHPDQLDSSKRRKSRRSDSDDSSQGSSKTKRAIRQYKDIQKANVFPGAISIPSLESYLEDSSTKGVDKITYGDLEVSQEAIARPISAHARKFLPKHPVASSSGKKDKLVRKKEGDVHQGTSRNELPELTSGLSDESPDDTKGPELDRDLTESTEDVHSTSQRRPPTADAEVQTPTRRFRQRQNRRSQPDSTESLISTESEEIIHIDSMSGDSNPMGKMRKRFHQFLDEAFNVIGKNDDQDLKRSKSAKVSVMHEFERREVSRPWTSRVVREEALTHLRPKSASLGLPKRAWASASRDRRCNSAKSTASASGSLPQHQQSGKAFTIFEKPDDSESESVELSSTVVQAATERSQNPNLVTNQPNLSSFQQPVFPNYSLYPDVSEPGRTRPQAGSDRADPAVPLILAIKEEIKRFEKVIVPDEEVPRSSGT